MCTLGYAMRRGWGDRHPTLTVLISRVVALEVGYMPPGKEVKVTHLGEKY